MLLRFSVSNHLSFKEPQELSFVASSLKDREDGLIACPPAATGYVLPAVLIYGPNASGKSNLLDALRFMQREVVHSQVERKPGDGVARQAFQLDPDTVAAPTRCEIDFVIGGIRHHYGFEASDDEFLSEWLYDFPHARARMLFERNRGSFRFGRAMRGQNRAISELTRPNSLFLSAAAQSGHKRLGEIFGYFRSFRAFPLSDILGDMIPTTLNIETLDDRIIDFLISINTGVTGYRRHEIEVSEETQKIARAIADETGSNMLPSSRHPVIELAHEGQGGDPVYLDFGRESAGTRRLLLALFLAFRAIDEGRPFIFDELDASLHTQAAEAVLRLFCSPETNPRGAQLVATTHDTNLLKSPLLRRGQVWFTEKVRYGATQLYPLTDIRTRKGDDIERAYLQGRYGAVPSDNLVSPLG